MGCPLPQADSSFCTNTHTHTSPPETPSVPHLHKDALRVGPGDGMHGIKDEAEVLAGHEGLEQGEVKHLLWGGRRRGATRLQAGGNAKYLKRGGGIGQQRGLQQRVTVRQLEAQQ